LSRTHLEDAVDPERKYPFLKPLLSTLKKRHRKTIGLVIAAIAVAGQARSFAIATVLARWLGTQLGSAVNRFYRLLRNHRVDYEKFLVEWIRLLQRKDRPLLIAVDWTEWHRELRVLAAAVVVGKRAIPVFVQACSKIVRTRSQNARENTFLRLLCDGLRRAEAKAVLLFDRGFRRVSLISLMQKLEVGFVVRLMSDVTAELDPDGERVALIDILLEMGTVLDLGLVGLRQDSAVLVRVIGYWAPGAHEPWWLATSETCDARLVLKFYDRRMTVEEQFRDTKGCRFGAKLLWTQFRDPEALTRFVTLLAVALLIWLLAGTVAAAQDRSLLLICRKKGPRQSFITIGVRITAQDFDQALMTAGWIAAFLAGPALRVIAGRPVGGK
jgi:hypothetical protein